MDALTVRFCEHNDELLCSGTEWNGSSCSVNLPQRQTEVVAVTVEIIAANNSTII